MQDRLSRRSFMGAVVAAAATTMFPTRAVFAQGEAGPHPTPRPGITGEKVLAKDRIPKAETGELFDQVRVIPEVMDGVRCSCGCAGSGDKYSLLSCYEGDGAMAKWCPVCQGEGRLVVRLHKEGKTLDEIRTAVDAKFS